MESKVLKNTENFIALFGHKDLKLYTVGDKVLKVMGEIVSLDIPKFNSSELSTISCKRVEKDAADFYASKFKLRDIRYLSSGNLSYLLYNSDIRTYDDIVNIYNNAGVLVSPYAIPIEYNINSFFAGTLEAQLLITDDENSLNDVLGKLNVCFNKIFLPKNITPLTTSCYIHELMHSQLESQRGIVEDYYNDETLSVFMEMLSSYERKDNSFRHILALRIDRICKSFNRMYLYQNNQITDKRYGDFEFNKDCMYFISILKAFNLLEKYINGNNLDKKQILSEIQKVINGRYTLEEMLKQVDVSYDNSLKADITSQLISLSK